MTELEDKIGETIAGLLPKLDQEQKEKFLCFAEGMAAMAEAMTKGQPQAG